MSIKDFMSKPEPDKKEIKIPDAYKSEKDEVKSEVKEVKAEVKQTPQTFVIKTEMDAYINERLQTQPTNLDEIEVRPFNYDQPKNRVALPKEVEALFKKRNYSPRWINKDKKMIDHAINDRGWLLVNKTYFKELPNHIFTANGTIENGDSILGFMPAKQAEILRRRPGQISQERIKNLPINKWQDDNKSDKISYYKPVLTGEKDGEMETIGIQPDKPSNE